MQVQLLLDTNNPGDLSALYRMFGIALPQTAPEPAGAPEETPPEDPAVVGNHYTRTGSAAQEKRRTKAEMATARAAENAAALLSGVKNTPDTPPAASADANPEPVAASAQLLDAVDVTLKYAAAFGTERLSQRMAEAKIERLESAPTEVAQPFLRKLLDEVEIAPHIQKVVEAKGADTLRTALAGKRIGDIGTLTEQVAFLEELIP